MIDNFALALSHGLMLLAAWRLMRRPDLDDDRIPPPLAQPGRSHGFARTSKEKRPGA